MGCVPGRPERRGVGQVERAETIDGHFVEERGGIGINTFGDFGATVSHELGAEKATAALVADDANVDAGSAWVISLVVVWT